MANANEFALPFLMLFSAKPSTRFVSLLNASFAESSEMFTFFSELQLKIVKPNIIIYVIFFIKFICE